MSIPAAPLPAQPVPTAPTPPTRSSSVTAEPSASDDRFGFWDFVDIINPLQHIPVVSTIYRELTGDEIKPAARIIGSTVYGGPVGLAVASADVLVEESTGRTVGGHVAAAIGLSDEDIPDDASSQDALHRTPGSLAMASPMTAEGGVERPPELVLTLDRQSPSAAVNSIPATSVPSDDGQSGVRPSAPSIEGLRFYDLPARRGLPGAAYAQPPSLEPGPASAPDPATTTVPPLGQQASWTRVTADGSSPGRTSVDTAPVTVADGGPDVAVSDIDQTARIDAALQAMVGGQPPAEDHPMLAEQLNVSDAMLAALDRYGQAQSLSR